MNRTEEYYVPSAFEVSVLQNMFKWSVGQTLDPKSDYLGSVALVEQNKTDFFDLKSMKVGGVDSIIYVGNLPSLAANSSNKLIFGVTSAKLFPYLKTSK